MLFSQERKYINLNYILGCKKQYNLVISARHGGKTTAVENGLMYKNWLKGYSTVIFERYKEDIFWAKIKSMEERINDLLPEEEQIELKATYNTSGVLYVNAKRIKADKDEKPTLFTTIMAVNNRLKNSKQITITNCKYVIFDEYIIDPQKGEKYLPNEWFSIKTICDTLRKKNPKLRFIALGNPYSKYSPFIAEFGIKTSKMVPNSLLKGPNWAVWMYDLPEYYKEELRARNKEYEGHDDYAKWALGGEFINDKFVHIRCRAPKYKLWFLIQIEGKTLGIYDAYCYKYPVLVKVLPEGMEKHKNRITFAKEFHEAQHGCILIDKELTETVKEYKEDFYDVFLDEFKFNRVAFHDLTSYYLFQAFYLYTTKTK